ncbi:tetratricopeptide repeat protein [Streptomyces sp. NPDC008317]|uniref:tetratricopeptide repeat protein n=1 Tax=Streptomyces sp. NPDC008317 TaxID=3364827 RepID=UPI0036E37B96
MTSFPLPPLPRATGSSAAASASPYTPNTAFRQLRGDRSPGEFAAAVRRAAREIGEHVSCDARYIGRLESGEIRCPNYAYQRVFRHLFPDLTSADMGFAPRRAVRGRARRSPESGAAAGPPALSVLPSPTGPSGPAGPASPTASAGLPDPTYEESDVLRRAFMTGGSAALASTLVPAQGGRDRGRTTGRAGSSEVRAVHESVRQIRLHDDRHGADGLYDDAGDALRTAYRLLDESSHGPAVAAGLASGAGELAISVGWLAHDSGRLTEARSYYAEALATARMAGDSALEAHAFCNTAFLARDAGRPREAVRAAQAAQLLARFFGSPRLLSLLALREAGGRAGLGDRRGCELALSRAHSLFASGPRDADPAWMTFFGEAELSGLAAQAWSALGAHSRAAAAAREAVRLQDPHFTRNIALYEAELALNLAASGQPEEAQAARSRALRLLGQVRSSRIRAMLVA